MTIGDILREKGQHVVAIWPEHTVGDAIRICAEQNISAVVIADHDGHPIGIVSGRDAASPNSGLKACRRA